jgi:deoxyuridine 5'-triphosphate nucleotidohydrolase
MKIAKLYAVKTPQRGTPGSAGIDFFVPESSDEFIKDFREKNPLIQMLETRGENPNRVFFELPAQQHVLIPSGIKAIVPPGFALIAFNKSGIAVNKGLDIGACLVDSDYRGVIHISLTNTSNHITRIYCDEKIVQFVLLPVFFDTIEEVDPSVIENDLTERGSGGFGSTNK